MELRLISGQPARAAAIMREVAAWGRERGLRVWPEEWLTPEQLLTDEARAENFYVAEADGEEACALILQWSDREWWPDAPPFEAGYLHKLCVRRRFAHRGMAARVVEAAKAECARRGVRRLRLDTGAGESVVRDVYLAAGFEVVRTVEQDGRPVMLLYELKF